MRTATPRQPPRTPKTAREWWVASVLLVAIAAATVVVVALSKSHLPDPMGSHFSGFANSPPDGFSSRTANLLVMPAIVVALCVLAWVVWFVSTSFAVRRWVVAGGSGIAMILFAALLSVIVANYGLTDAHDARTGALDVLWPIVGAVVIAALALYVYGPVPESERNLSLIDSDRPLIEVSPTERVSWSHRGHSDLLIAIGLVVTLVPLVLVFVGMGPSLLIAVVAGVIALQFAFYNVRITNDKIVVRSGAIPFASMSMHMRDVDHADYADKISPLRYGGWGLRMRPNGRNLIMGSGPALLVRMTNGNEHVISMPSPREAAGVINGVLRHATRGAS
ncbi:hypothetical protein CLV47_10865 [Antricoccus suffuscus]|uniref:DUF1648 domain-containing protein n=1 Tax=Antricoccus suffuscus TaxID=1629062 RepID=A0A2T0ZZC1_9ACTN|nr:hypothetical protein CLV47_10865 [Antricoccus suffuscus]